MNVPCPLFGNFTPISRHSEIFLSDKSKQCDVIDLKMKAPHACFKTVVLLVVVVELLRGGVLARTLV